MIATNSSLQLTVQATTQAHAHDKIAALAQAYFGDARWKIVSIRAATSLSINSWMADDPMVARYEVDAWVQQVADDGELASL